MDWSSRYEKRRLNWLSTAGTIYLVKWHAIFVFFSGNRVAKALHRVVGVCAMTSGYSTSAASIIAKRDVRGGGRQLSVSPVSTRVRALSNFLSA
jgi:hypothetical protein